MAAKLAGLDPLHRLKSTKPPFFFSPSPDLSQAARIASRYLFSSLKPFAPKSPFSRLLTKGFDAEQIWQQITNEDEDEEEYNEMLKVLRYLDDRMLVHKNAISFCQNILKKKALDWKTVFRNDLSQSIRGVDLVISVGGDGTLLLASHFMDDSVPVLGVNSDPTQQEEVEEFCDEFDATRSTGYLCAATTNNFERARSLLPKNQNSMPLLVLRDAWMESL